MFSVLNVVNEKRSAFRRRRCSVEMLLSPVKGAAPYKVINVSPGRKGIDWKTVALAAGNSAEFMLLPQGIKAPETSGIKEFIPKFLPGVILLNTVASVAAESGSKNHSAVIVDKGGELAEYVERIVPYVAKITVVTQLPEAYFEPSVDIMERFGATVKVCMQLNESEQFDYGISDEEIECATRLFRPSSVLNGEYRIEIPEEYRKLCPQGIDPFLFACALFECSGLKSVGELTLSSV